MTAALDTRVTELEDAIGTKLLNRMAFDMTAAEANLANLAPIKTLLVNGVAWPYDAADTTSTHNGTTVIVSADGRRYKPVDLSVDTIPELQAIAGQDTTDIVYLTLSGSAGWFRWSTADESISVARDELNAGQGDGGVYVAPNSNLTGGAGAWVRDFKGPIEIEWYRGSGLQQAVDTGNALDVPVNIPPGVTYSLSSSVDCANKTVIIGGGTLSFSGSGSAFSLSETIALFDVSGIKYTSTLPLIDITYDIDAFYVNSCEIENCNKIVETTTTNTELKDVRIQDNNCHDCGSGFVMTSNRIGNAVATGNTFKDFSRSGTIFCLIFGDNNTSDQDNRGDYIVSNNVFENIISTSLTAETHAIICFGLRASIVGNIVCTLNNAGITGAEAIYTKCRFSTIAANVVENGGYSLNGAISIKGQDRDGSGAPFGYGCSVTGNVIRATGTDNSVGIFLQNESIICSGNYLEGNTNYDIVVATTNGSAVNVSNNVISKSQSRWAINCELDCHDLVISDNTVSEMIGKPSLSCYAIYIGTATTGIKRASITGNVMSVDVSSSSTSLDAIQINTENDGSLFENILISNNNADMSAAGNGRGIRILGQEPIENLSIIGNIITADGIRDFDISNTVTVSGVANIRDNKFVGVTTRTSSANLDWEHVNQPVIYTGTGAANMTLPEATVGANFKLVNGNTAGSAVGFARSGTDAFRGSNTQATISDEGMICVECFVAGTWDVTHSTSAVTLA